MLEDIFDIKLIEQVAESIFSRSSRMIVERVEEGVSTYVYRIYYAGEIFYLRVLPEPDASFAPEVYVHRLLRDRQVKVPEIVYFAHCNEMLQRSIMVTTDIKGTHLYHDSLAQDLRAVLLEAGRDLAVINSLPVKHFGWVKRDKKIYFSSLLIAIRALARSVQKKRTDIRNHQGLQSIRRDLQAIQLMK